MQTLRAITGLLIGSLILSFSQLTPLNASTFSDEELQNFGLQLEYSLSSQNPYYFNLSFDTEQLLKNVFEEYGHSPDNNFHQGFVDGIISNLDIGSLLVNELSSGGNIELISVRTEGEKPSLIFRLTGAKGINYHEYYVESLNDKLKLTDVYIYSTGQLISESVGQLYVSSWYNIENDYARELQKINQLKFDRKIKKAFHIWEQLPDAAKKEKANLLLGIELSTHLNTNDFYNTYNLFSLHYPEEPGKYLIPLDGLIASGLYETALQNLDSLDKLVQTDPILDFVRANIYYEAHKPAKAKESLNKLIEAMPQFELAYFSLLDIYLKENDYQGATGLLSKMTLVFNNYKEDYTPLFADYPDFIESNEYRDWIQD